MKKTILLLSASFACLFFASCDSLTDSKTNSLKNLNQESLPPGSLSGVVQIVSADRHVCAVLQSGKVKCWGRNNTGQLGDGTTSIQYRPVEVVGLSDVKMITTSIETNQWTYTPNENFTCALTNGGKVYCWGANTEGQLGNGDIPVNYPIKSPLPVRVPGIDNAIKISSYGYMTCAQLQNGQVKCWGYSNMFSGGDASVGDWQRVPKEIPELLGATSIIVSGTGIIPDGAHIQPWSVCGIFEMGKVRCWNSWFGLKEIVGLDDVVNLYAVNDYPNALLLAKKRSGDSIVINTDRRNFSDHGTHYQTQALNEFTNLIQATGTYTINYDSSYNNMTAFFGVMSQDRRVYINQPPMNLKDRFSYTINVGQELQLPSLPLEYGRTTMLVEATEFQGSKDIAVGGGHLCALMENGGVKCAMFLTLLTPTSAPLPDTKLAPLGLGDISVRPDHPTYLLE